MTHEQPINAPIDFRPFPFDAGFAHHVGPLFWCKDRAPPALGFRVLDHHVNPAGVCHGGMMVTVMDMALGIAMARAGKFKGFVPTVNMTTDFLRPAKHGDWLESKVEFGRASRRMAFAEGLLIGPDGPVLRCNGIGKLPNKDDPVFGSVRVDPTRR